MTQEAYAQLERRAEVPFSTRVWRGQVGLILVMLIVALLVGITAAVDLRRLQTPVGTAQAWVEATVFGDCVAYRKHSVAVAGRQEVRSDQEVCRALRAKVAEGDPELVRVRTVLVRRSGRTALVSAEVTRGPVTTPVQLTLQRRGDGWAVVRDEEGCRVGCA